MCDGATWVSEVGVQPEGVVGGARHHAHPLVLAHSLLEEVGLALQRDVLHEVKGVLHAVDLHTDTQHRHTTQTHNTDTHRSVWSDMTHTHLADRKPVSTESHLRPFKKTT